MDLDADGLDFPVLWNDHFQSLVWAGVIALFFRDLNQVLVGLQETMHEVPRSTSPAPTHEDLPSYLTIGDLDWYALHFLENLSLGYLRVMIS